MGREALALISSREQVDIREAFRRIRKFPTDSIEVITSMTKKDGNDIWIQGSATNLLADPAVGAVVVSFRDITELKRAEEAQRKSEEMLQAAVRVADIGIFDHDQHADTIYWSPRQREIHGWGQDEPISLQTFFTLLHPDDKERIMAEVMRAHDPAGTGVFGMWSIE